jgi:hypothetical protein
MNPLPTEHEPEERPKAAIRYTYASGSQPLEGYTIKRGVGRGGFGEVYFALSDAGKEVALKLIRRNLDVEIRGVTHCLNLKHTNLISLYDIRTDEHDDRWVVMEYVSGESLEDAIERYPQGMPIDEVLAWFTGMAAGVAYLHDHGIVHRDLKPANIFLDDSTVKIGDYGLSKFISCSRRSGQTESVGTVHYMAPEIANGRYGKEIDTYALGIILYEMLTGHVPFEGESVGEVLMKHLTAEPDLSVLAEPYRGLVRRAMAKDPEARFRSVEEMIQRLPPASLPPTAVLNRPAAGANGKQLAETVAYVGPASAASAQAERRSEEPILASLQEGWHQARRSFQQSTMHPLLKSVILFVIVIGLVALSPEWLSLFMVVGFCYLVYRAIRTLVLEPHAASSSVMPSHPRAHARPGNSPGGFSGPEVQAALLVEGKRTRPKGRRRQSWQQHLRQHLAIRPLRDRVKELLGGMLLAVAVAAIASLLISLIFTNSMPLEFYAWMTLSIILASWAIMIPSKLAEGRVEDQAPLRFAQLVLGAVVGLLSWVIASKLMIALPAWPNVGIGPLESGTSALFGELGGQTLKEGFQAGAVQLPWQVFTGYFAFMFVLLAWWRNAECSRANRVSLWSIAWCCLVAWMLHFVWWFPQPIGLLVAGATAFTVQLASPWMPPSQRRALVEAEA